MYSGMAYHSRAKSWNEGLKHESQTAGQPSGPIPVSRRPVPSLSLSDAAAQSRAQHGSQTARVNDSGRDAAAALAHSGSASARGRTSFPQVKTPRGGGDGGRAAFEDDEELDDPHVLDKPAWCGR